MTTMGSSPRAVGSGSVPPAPQHELARSLSCPMGGILLPFTTFRKLSKCRLICQAPFRRVVAMRLKARLTDPMVGAVVALGITQITAWGTSFYCLGVLAGPISQDTG